MISDLSAKKSGYIYTFAREIIISNNNNNNTNVITFSDLFVK